MWTRKLLSSSLSFSLQLQTLPDSMRIKDSLGFTAALPWRPSFPRGGMALSYGQMVGVNAQKAVCSEGDGGLSKLNIGGGRPKSKAKKADGGPTNWDPKGTLTKPKKLSAC